MGDVQSTEKPEPRGPSSLARLQSHCAGTLVPQGPVLSGEPRNCILIAHRGSLSSSEDTARPRDSSVEEHAPCQLQREQGQAGTGNVARLRTQVEGPGPAEGVDGGPSAGMSVHRESLEKPSGGHLRVKVHPILLPETLGTAAPSRCPHFCSRDGVGSLV